MVFELNIERIPAFAWLSWYLKVRHKILYNKYFLFYAHHLLRGNLLAIGQSTALASLGSSEAKRDTHESYRMTHTVWVILYERARVNKLLRAKRDSRMRNKGDSIGYRHVFEHFTRGSTWVFLKVTSSKGFGCWTTLATIGCCGMVAIRGFGGKQLPSCPTKSIEVWLFFAETPLSTQFAFSEPMFRIKLLVNYIS